MNLKKLKLHTTTDMDLIKKYMDDEVEMRRGCICSNPNITVELLEIMYDKETVKDIIIKIIRNNNVTNRILWNEYKKNDVYTIPYVLTSEKISRKLISEVIMDGNPLYKSLIVGNNTIPEDMFFSLLDDDSDINIKLGAIYNKNIPIEKMISYYQSNNSYLKIMICKSKFLTKEIYDLILNDSDDFKIEISKSDFLDIYAIEKLYKDSNKEIRNNITLNKNTPLHILEEMRDTDTELLIKKNSTSAIYLFHNDGDL